jgi:hypothetical protein
VAKNSDQTKLRRARSRAHFALTQAEMLAQGYRDKLADLEARIQAIAGLISNFSPDSASPTRSSPVVNCAGWRSTCSGRQGSRWRSGTWRWARYGPRVSGSRINGP